jgi:Amino acid transporters
MSEMKDNDVFVDSPVDGAQQRLEQLGYKQVLDRRLSVFGNVVMGLSNVAPVMAAFLYGLAAFSVAGTGAIGAAWMQGINVCLIGLILAEAGSIYPVSGGLYSLVKYMLPRPLAFVAVFTFMIQAFIYPPAISMGLGLYLQELFPALPQTEMATSVIAAIALILSLFIGLNNIVTSNRVAKFSWPCK